LKLTFIPKKEKFAFWATYPLGTGKGTGPHWKHLRCTYLAS